NEDWNAEGLLVARSLEEAIEKGKEIDPEIFIIGGGKIYEQAMNLADALEDTEVHHSFEGDTKFPEIDLNIWQETSRKDFEKDERHIYDYSFVRFERKI